MALLKDADRQAVRERLAEMTGPVTLHVFTQNDQLVIPGRTPCPYSKDTEELMQEVAGLSDHLTVILHDRDGDKEGFEQFGITQVPVIVPVAGEDEGVRFFGLPAGYEFATFLETLVEMGGGEEDDALDEDIAARLEAIDQPVTLRVFFTPT